MSAFTNPSLSLECLMEIERYLQEGHTIEQAQELQVILCRILASTGMAFDYIKSFNAACRVAYDDHRKKEATRALEA